MIIVLKQNTTKEDIKEISNKLKERNLKPVEFDGVERTVIHVLGNVTDEIANHFSSFSQVENVVRILKPFKLASKEHKAQKTVIDIENVKIGNGDVVMIAGPCSVESEEQIMQAANMLQKLGIKIMRASAFKPRTSPYDFQGLGIKGLKLLKKVKDKTGILVETEVMDVRDVPIAAEYVDVLRVGARNMQNYDLLKELGKIN